MGLTAKERCSSGAPGSDLITTGFGKEAVRSVADDGFVKSTDSVIVSKEKVLLLASG